MVWVAPLFGLDWFGTVRSWPVSNRLKSWAQTMGSKPSCRRQLHASTSHPRYALASGLRSSASPAAARTPPRVCVAAPATLCIGRGLHRCARLRLARTPAHARLRGAASGGDALDGHHPLPALGCLVGRLCRARHASTSPARRHTSTS